jgi:cytochrome oxidase Cu insertion factor (SCO1/SenC/PrrC family)
MFLLLAAGMAAAEAQQVQKRKPLQGNLKIGDAAPDFTIKDIDGKVETTLSKFQGKPVVLIFGSCT